MRSKIQKLTVLTLVLTATLLTITGISSCKTVKAEAVTVVKEEASVVVPIVEIGAPSNTIYYTSNNNGIVRPFDTEAFGEAKIVGNTYAEGRGCLTFDKDIKTIGDNAFKKCSRLTSITLPKGLQTIGDYAFMGCVRLAEAVIPNSVKYIGSNAFLNCRKLDLTLSDIQGVDSIGEYAFASCVRLKGSLSSLSNVVKVGHYAFADCNELVKDYAIPGCIEDTITTEFRFLTWNIQGLAWGTNHEPHEADSIVESRGVKQLIARYNPRIYVGNEVPSYLSHGKEPEGTVVKLVCGDDENKVFAVHAPSFLMNTITTKDVLVECWDHQHLAEYTDYRNHVRHTRHFGVATQYIDGEKVAIVAVHFEPTPQREKEKNKHQIDSIRYLQAKEVVDEVRHFDHVIVAGDFNTNVNHNGQNLGGVATLFEEAGFEDVAYYKPGKPYEKQYQVPWNVDHIFIKGLVANKRGFGDYDRKLSDHPLHWVDLKVKK